MTVKELIRELLKYDMDEVVQYTDVDLGWTNIWLTGDKHNPKIIPSIPEKHATQKWIQWAMNEEKLKDN